MNNFLIGRETERAASALATCRAAAPGWAATPLRLRLRVVRRARQLMAGQAHTLAATVRRPLADTIVAEILPLLEAARFLERRASHLLAPRRLRGGRPLWLTGVSAEIWREPLGSVLILAPANYPLFLPGAQALQALVAGNTVCLKPAPAGAVAAAALASLLARAGLPEGVLNVLQPEDGAAATAAGFDHIVLTGSAETGAEVLRVASARLTPTTMELSGCDAVYVLAGADLTLVARSLAYGMRLNGGATCIAPRRVMVPRDVAGPLEAMLLPLLAAIAAADVPEPVAGRLASSLEQAVAMGARASNAADGRPVLLSDARPEMALLQQDVFAPWLALVPVADIEEALRADALCPFALGASVFGPVDQARALTARLRAGSVCINDLIVPTADPRLPFGGSGRSGFGRSRGAEGLLAMTAVKSISVRRGRFRPHLAAPNKADATRFAILALLLHGGWRELLRRVIDRQYRRGDSAR